MQGVRFRVRIMGFRVPGSVFRAWVQDFGFGVQGLGFRVQGVPEGLRVMRAGELSKHALRLRAGVCEPGRHPKP